MEISVASHFGYNDSCRLANFNTASTAQALIGLIWKGSAVLKLKNVYRTNLYTFLISYTYIRINYDLKHNLSLSWTSFIRIGV